MHERVYKSLVTGGLLIGLHWDGTRDDAWNVATRSGNTLTVAFNGGIIVRQHGSWPGKPKTFTKPAVFLCPIEKGEEKWRDVMVVFADALQTMAMIEMRKRPREGWYELRPGVEPMGDPNFFARPFRSFYWDGSNESFLFISSKLPAWFVQVESKPDSLHDPMLILRPKVQPAVGALNSSWHLLSPGFVTPYDGGQNVWITEHRQFVEWFQPTRESNAYVKQG